jgi:hypothetical protein
VRRSYIRNPTRQSGMGNGHGVIGICVTLTFAFLQLNPSPCTFLPSACLPLAHLPALTFPCLLETFPPCAFQPGLLSRKRKRKATHVPVCWAQRRSVPSAWRLALREDEGRVQRDTHLWSQKKTWWNAS